MPHAFEDELHREVQEILRHHLFERSPTHNKLLSYLLTRTLDEGSSPTTQYDIATEALGKSDSFDENSDSYVRVQISRLRDRLTTYYSQQRPVGSGFVYLKKGQYRLSLASGAVAYPGLLSASLNERETPDTMIEEGVAPVRRWTIKDLPSTLLSAVVIAFSALTFSVFKDDAASFFSVQTDPAYSGSSESIPEGLAQPIVSYRVVSHKDFEGPAGALSSAIDAEIEHRLGRSVVAIPGASGARAHFDINVQLDQPASDTLMAIVQLTDEVGTVIVRHELPIPNDPQSARRIIGLELATLLSPPGALARHLSSKISGDPKNDFECFVLIETGRAGGQTVEDLLDICTAAYPGSTFYPFLRARELFAELQREMLAKKAISLDSEIQEKLGNLLRQYPENPYLNTLAAKILYSNALCEEASRHATIALARGRDYPALELMILVDKGACLDSPEEWADLRNRIDEIIQAQTEPHALLEAYAVAGLLLVDRPEMVERLPSRPFSFERDLPVIELTDGLRHFASGRQSGPPQYLEVLIWSEQSRSKIIDNVTARRRL